MPLKTFRAPLPFPIRGLSDRGGYAQQAELTTVSAANVRGYEAKTGRLRGGTRAGLAKYLSAQINGSSAVQRMFQVAVSSAVSGTSVRTLYNMAVAGGTVKLFTTAGTTTATNGTTALDTTSPYLFGAEMFGVVYFADGTNEKQWTASTNTVAAWTASAGSLPVSGSNRPRLICKWRNRIVVSGIVGDGQNWFMSAIGDARDWDYTVAEFTAAVAGNNDGQSKSPDIITALIPFSDDLLIFGGDHSIYQMTNDPLDGGQIDLLSDTTGIAFGKAWCRDPSGLVYFFGSRGGLYVLAPGAPPVRLSDPIEERLAAIDLSANTVSLEWDDRNQHVLIFVTPTADAAGTHFAFDVRQKAFWPDTYAANGLQPRCTLVLDGDATGDRCVLLGCRDGYIRKIDYTAEGDDGSAINSFVYLGPVHLPNWFGFRTNELTLQLGRNSDDVTYTWYAGSDPEAVFNASAWFTGTWTSTTTIPDRTRSAGTAGYLKIGTNTLGASWQYESGSVDLLPLGKAATRFV